jgi:hypothetical protein
MYRWLIKPFLLLNLKSDLLFDKWSRVEVLKAMDKYGFISNSSHGILDIRRYPKMLLIMEVIYLSYTVMESRQSFRCR